MKLLNCSCVSIKVAARDSPLSRAQVKEVYEELILHHPHVQFECQFIKTYGDKDRTTSLRTLGQTDFFTKEIDEWQKKGGCRIAIHSAKDLAEPLDVELEVVAITKGVDPSDSLVMREKQTLDSLPKGAVIATSSLRREQNVCQLRKDFRFVDIRGYIEERLEKLMDKEVDGVVIAEAALIRLGLTHYNRIRLPGQTAPLQGKLAIIARKGDDEMKTLFNRLF